MSFFNESDVEGIARAGDECIPMYCAISTPAPTTLAYATDAEQIQSLLSMEHKTTVRSPFWGSLSMERHTAERDEQFAILSNVEIRVAVPCSVPLVLLLRRGKRN